MDDGHEINSQLVKINQVERQLEHSSYYNQTVLSQYANRINEVESFLFGLIDLLAEKKTIDIEDLQSYVSRIKDEVKQKGEVLHAGIAMRIDGKNEHENNFIPVNCQERIHICQGICCKLNFALSPGEVDSGKIKWDLGRPYFIRHEKNGYCSHFDENKKCCSVYDNRPRICSGYSCANDERIWKDFEQMTLNTEWIEANLSDGEPKMFLMDIHQRL